MAIAYGGRSLTLYGRDKLCAGASKRLTAASAAFANFLFKLLYILLMHAAQLRLVML